MPTIGFCSAHLLTSAGTVISTPSYRDDWASTPGPVGVGHEIADSSRNSGQLANNPVCSLFVQKTERAKLLTLRPNCPLGFEVIPVPTAMKHSHEFRDPIHTFISVRSNERKVIDSRPFQRLRHIHQLALSYLVYPGATHKRFEHSLGVMDVASRIFDVVTNPENIYENSVREIIPDREARSYWRSVLRMAALCHDVGHLPFSHAAEKELLPDDYDHERLTKELISSEEMQILWASMRPPLTADHIVKLAVGAKGAVPLELDIWETILAEIIIGDAFGADRMDYLLRDSYHAGVAYGTFDHHRLISSLRILPKQYEDFRRTCFRPGRWRSRVVRRIDDCSAFYVQTGLPSPHSTSL